MSNGEPTVFIVDDDDAVRDSLEDLVDSVGLKAEIFASAQEFLAAYDPLRAGCLVLDIRMPGMSGLELQEKLGERQAVLPIIFITGHGDIPMAVEAMRRGAVDFIQKPFRDQDLLDRINSALAQGVERL
jgi:two-component system, LuxR family, response regulator FixJ